MRITITQGAFLPVPPLRGGAVEKVWFELGKEFAKAGHFVTHISRAFSGLPKSEWIENVNHVRVQGYDAPKSILLLKALDLFYSIRVARQLPAADILVTNTFWLPVIVRSQKWGQLYVHVARYPRGQMKLYRHAARLQTVSDPIKEAIATEVDVSESKLSTIPYPVWGQDVRAAAPVHARRKEILFVGRIHPEKGLHLLIEAFLHISPMKRKEWRLVIVGSTEFNTGGGGPGYREAILGRAALLGDKIDWVGPVYESIKLNEFYRRASLFVYPSLAERGETFGLAPLEAMSNGCPALVSNLRCFREYLDAEVDGFVFDHRVQEPSWELAKRIEELIENPSVLIAASAAGLVKARGFSLPRVAQMFLDDFEKLLPRSPSAS